MARIFVISSEWVLDSGRLVWMRKRESLSLVSNSWRRATISDDPVHTKNEVGTATFAISGRNTQTTQFPINLKDTSRLDSTGSSPLELGVFMPQKTFHAPYSFLAQRALGWIALVLAVAVVSPVWAEDGLNHYGYHRNDDGFMLDLDNNGGMMGSGDPESLASFYGVSVLTDGPGSRGLDFDNDTDFLNTGSIGQADNYSNLWLGMLHVSPADAGTWYLRNAGDDDRAGIWIDLDKDGVFESSTPGLGSDRGEQLSWEDTNLKSVSLSAGDYMVAFTHREGGGGSRADFRFASPTITTETIIKPSDPAQAGIWQVYPPVPVEIISFFIE